MSKQLIKSVIYLLMLVSRIDGAPKFLSCISFLEDDGSVLDDIELDEYLLSSTQSESEHASREAVAPTTSIPYHRRICQSDYTFCFALWHQTENGSIIEKQGCWKESTERNATCSHTACVSSAPTSRNNSLFYCCCSGDICNQNVSVVSPPSVQLKVITPALSNYDNEQNQDDSDLKTLLFWCFLVVSCILVSILATYVFYSSIKKKSVAEEAPLAPSGPGYSSNLRNVDNINLVCMLGRGKYGTVMKGLLHDREVAVKIFPEAHYQYYINERNIYSLPLMESPSLLAYLGYDEHHTTEGKIEYQLVLSLAPLGCLQDWLIATVMDFETFCGMTKSVTRGLSHLHTELRSGDKVKPCIAHRDLNSRNILVKSDRSCCIADFGFALKVFGSKYEYKGEIAAAETKSIAEVGTLRYMAPELLEGAVNLRDCETSLKQMDVYALGLILWELATRCSDFYPPAKVTPPYKGPYELEVGTHPTFDQMQALVVRHKARPLFPAGWGGGPAAKLVRDTCEDCWDHDAEARLTSLCAEERMQEVAGLLPLLHLHAQTVSPLLSANNLIGDLIVDPSHHKLSNLPDIALEKTAIINLPPNQQVYLSDGHTRNELGKGCGIINAVATEKNHLIHPQQQLQPYQGRNPCQERNLAPITTHLPQVLVQKSKKHSFRPNEENSFSCLEDDVSVEDLLSNGSSQKFSYISNDTSNLGHGFPKQHNTEKKLRGWHGVRALIQKRLFRKEDSTYIFSQQECGDEKSNLVDSCHISGGVSIMKGANCSLPESNRTVSLKQIDLTTAKSALNGVQSLNRRPNNLDLSSVPSGNLGVPVAGNKIEADSCARQSDATQCLESRNSTAIHIVPRSISTSRIRCENPANGVVDKSVVQNLSESNADKRNEKILSAAVHQIRRQSSLDVFHEVFNGRGSTGKLRDPSQRVKTPGDVPPSVRRIRASKTLSLYDDRMMDSSSNLNNHIL